MSADVSDPRDDRDSQFVLVVDLGTGGPKVGFASLLGRVVHPQPGDLIAHQPGAHGGEDSEDRQGDHDLDEREGLAAGVTHEENPPERCRWRVRAGGEHEDDGDVGQIARVADL